MRKFLLSALCMLLACAVSTEKKARTILEQGLNDRSKAVRVAAALGLDEVEPERGARALLAMLEGSEPEIQAACLEGLVTYSTQEPRLDPEIVRLCASPSVPVRVAALRNAALSADPEAKALLLQAVNDESARVRQVAYAGLAKFNEPDVLDQGFRDGDMLVRVTVARALGLAGADGMVEAIIEELKNSAPDQLGPGVIMLAELGDTTVRGQLRILAAESTGELRVDVAEALLILEDRAGIDALEKAVQSNDPFVRIRAMDVLARYDVPDMREQIVEATRDEYVNVAVKAVQALAEHDASRYRKLFAELMDSSSPLLRITAAAAFLKD